MTRITRDEMFMEILKVVEKRSVCTRKQVAAVICKDNRPISIGYNGPPSGIDHCCREGDQECTSAIHAEMNAIAFAAKNGVSIDDTVLYVSMSPCLKCAQIILNTGITKVIFREMYRNTDGIALLSEFIEVEQYIHKADILTKDSLKFEEDHIEYKGQKFETKDDFNDFIKDKRFLTSSDQIAIEEVHNPTFNTVESFMEDLRSDEDE